MGGSAWEPTIDRKRLQGEENNDLEEEGEQTQEQSIQILQEKVNQRLSSSRGYGGH